MNLYTVSLFIHMIGFISLFGALVLLQNAGARLRASTTWQEARNLLELLRVTRGMFAAGGVLLLASGLYMASARWSLVMPWVMVATVMVVLFAVLGAVVVGGGIVRMGRAASEAEGPISEEGRALLTGPGVWTAICAMNGGALGIVWLMVAKPGWAESIGVPLALTVIGGFAGWTVARAKRTGALDRRGTGAAPRPVAHGG